MVGSSNWACSNCGGGKETVNAHEIDGATIAVMTVAAVVFS